MSSRVLLLSVPPFRRVPRAGRFALAALLGLLCLGCGGADNPDTVKVSGTVKYKGEPLTSGELRFIPVDDKKGRMAIGKIDESGNFTVSTFAPGDGVIPGEYRITVLAYKFDEKTPQRDRELNIGGTPAVPQKYFSVDKSGLKESITESRTLDLNLTDG